MACKSCNSRRKKRGIGAVSAADLNFKKIGAYGGGALLGAMTNSLATKILKPADRAKLSEEQANKKDAQNGMLWGAIKAGAAGYLAATSDDEMIQDMAIGASAGGLLEVAMYAFAVPIAAYPQGVKPVVIKGIGSYYGYTPPVHLPDSAYSDPMMQRTMVAGYHEASGVHAMAGTGMV